MKQNEQCAVILLLSYIVSKKSKNQTRLEGFLPQTVHFIQRLLSGCKTFLNLYILHLGAKIIGSIYFIVKRNLWIYHTSIQTLNITDCEQRLSVATELHQPHPEVAYLRQFPESSSMKKFPSLLNTFYTARLNH